MNKAFISQENNRALRNPWVLGWLAFVAVVLAMNLWLIALAMKTSPGLVDRDYYDHGRDFERNVLKQIAARNALGWETSFEAPERIVMAAPAVFRFGAVDSRGLPLRDAQVTLTAYRPADAAADFAVSMQDIAPGRYQAHVSFPLKGAWEVIVKVKRGGDDYDVTRRITVQQS